MREDGVVVIGTRLDTSMLEKDIKNAYTFLDGLKDREQELNNEKMLLEIRLKIDELDENQLKNFKKQVEDMGFDFDAFRDISLEDAQQELKDIEQEFKQINMLEQQSNETINEWNNKLRKIQIQKDFPKQIQEIGNGIKKVVKSITKWGLALISVRGIMGLISNSVSTLRQYDKQLSSDIEYMRYAIATALKPIIEWIIKSIYKLMQYVNYIAKAWFNVNLFANASVKNFKKAQTEAGKLKKTISSFDEMNVLDKKNEFTVPSLDLSKLEDVKIPGWIDWIAKNKDLLLGIAEALAIAFGISKLSKLASNLGILFTSKFGLNALASKLGAITAIAGGIAITAICAKKVWDDIKKLKDEMSNIRKIGEENWEKVVNEQKKSGELETELNVKRNAGIDLLKKSDNWFNKLTGMSHEMLENAKSVVFEGEKALMKEIEIYNNGKKTNEEKKKLTNEIQKQINYNNEVIKELESQGKSTKKVQESNKLLKEQLSIIKGDTEKTSKNLNNINKTKMNNKNMSINVNADTSKAKNSLKSLITSISDGVNNMLKKIDFESIMENTKNALTNFGSGVKKIFGFKSGGVVKCATGSIINLPGRGVPLSNAIGGEAGAEGIIPLTNSQMMEQLGEAIGKYITINANITNSMNGRVISRELQKIQNTNDFAMNR